MSDDKKLVKTIFCYLLSKKWRIGEKIYFEYGDWKLVIRRETKTYAPFLFSVEGEKTNGLGTIGRRYYTLEDALLHILNHFNENAAIKNRYMTMDDALNRILQ